MTETKVRYPEVKVQLVGQDGNAFSILGRVMKAMRAAGIDQDEISEFRLQATSGDYNHLLVTVTEWVSQDDQDDDDDWI